MRHFFELGFGLGLFIIIFICVGIVACCVALCCCCCKKRNPQRHQNVTTVVYTHPSSSQIPVSGPQPQYPAYQPVPQQAHGVPYMTAPPPSYQEATDPALLPHNPGMMFLHPSQPSGHSDVHTQLPYNPAFYPNTASFNQPVNKY
ncbi:protein shisa-5-like [Takifugu rubripes]|uniref:protein shisa-5-like n=1 Tax=Takifugu rubripes TaxID=31033 RepID=UPI00114524F9|nr:protein shisa-5-like [Takifugu rubripes]